MLDMIAFTYFLDKHGGNEELDGTDIIDGSEKLYDYIESPRRYVWTSS